MAGIRDLERNEYLNFIAVLWRSFFVIVFGCFWILMRRVAGAGLMVVLEMWLIRDTINF